MAAFFDFSRMRWLNGKRSDKPVKTRPSGRHFFSTSAIEEALKKGGCPVCVAVSASERRGIHSFLYEGMMSPIVREDFLKGSGFCSAHFTMAKAIEDECWPTGGFGMAILCEDLVRYAMRIVQERTPAAGRPQSKQEVFTPGSGCLFCKDNKRKERSLLEVLEELSDEDQFARPLKQGRLCLSHSLLALEMWTDDEKRQWIAKALDRCSEQLRADLREFIRKHDYQFRHEPKGSEHDSVERSAEFLFGSPYRQKKAIP